MISTTVTNAKATLSKLVEMVSHGEEVVISRGGTPVARLVQYSKPTHPRKGGQWRGRVHMSDDFDELPEDLTGMFEGRDS